MPPRKNYAEKGKPSFHNLTDETVKQYSEMLVDLYLIYGHQVDKTKHEVLVSVWNDLVVENTDRLVSKPFAEKTKKLEAEQTEMIRPKMIKKKMVKKST